jgi:pyruvate dehydrogenase E2 component (dihydrolipoamide acetyltransferase)
VGQPSAYVDIELTNMRKTIAKRLLESKTTIPHFYLNLNIEMDEASKARE